MSDDSPKIVKLETSLELSEFLSEAESPSEFVLPSDAEAATPVELEAQEVKAFAPLAEGPSEDGPTEEPVPASLHVGPATVTDFPVRPQIPAAVALPSLPAGPVTLVDLIERRGGFEWREAVAVIHQICVYLRDHSPHAPILLDPRTIQITDQGEVQLLSGQASSDPLVIQVGRLLRTMLAGKESPPELRLLLAQATFELPIFESIEDVDRALAQLNKLDEPGPVGLALLRAVAAPPRPPAEDVEQAYRPPSLRSILPAHRLTPRQPRGRTKQLRQFVETYASHVAVTVAVIAVIGALLLTRPAVLFPSDAPTAARSQAPPVAIAAVPPAVAERTATPANASVPSGPVTTPTPPPLPEPAVRPGTGVAAAPLAGRTGIGDRPRSGSSGPRPEATTGVAPVASTSRTASAPPAPRTLPAPRPVPTPPPPSARESERRAASLLEQGQTAAASMVFDALVLSNPLYEPRTSELTPEALAAFRTSQRLLLPVIAQRNYDRAQAALAAGDADRALALAKDTTAILDRRLSGIPPQLREQVDILVEQATTVAAAANEIIYTDADAGVIPPRPLTRQMPLTGPSEIPPNRIGWLDMVIGRDGTVENVKLHTPLNRHHERMIVSPAKAWRYRPATKAGRPVRYRILVRVNLPESGNEY